MGTPMEVDGSARGRSPSIVSALQTPVNGQASRRTGKGPNKKQPGMLSESLETGGHLPGYKDGVGVFPPQSEWAERMLSLKLKGKHIDQSYFLLSLILYCRKTISNEERADANGERWSTLPCRRQS